MDGKCRQSEYMVRRRSSLGGRFDALPPLSICSHCGGRLSESVPNLEIVARWIDDRGDLRCDSERKIYRLCPACQPPGSNEIAILEAFRLGRSPELTEAALKAFYEAIAAITPLIVAQAEKIAAQRPAAGTKPGMGE